MAVKGRATLLVYEMGAWSVRVYLLVIRRLTPPVRLPESVHHGRVHK